MKNLIETVKDTVENPAGYKINDKNMESAVVKILDTQFITHNVKRFVTEKPPGLTYISGQAADISINLPGFEKELRPFTFTSINGSDHLEFIIKIYASHHGVTEKLAQMNAGDELIIHEVFGTIQYKGPGLFLAAGAGITPFISILRQLKEHNALSGNTLLFANRTEEDIILKSELRQLLQRNYVDIIENQPGSSLGKYIDRELLQNYVNADQYYYICGPDKFISTMLQYLTDLGVHRSKVVIEE